MSFTLQAISDAISGFFTETTTPVPNIDVGTPPITHAPEPMPDYTTSTIQPATTPVAFGYLPFPVEIHFPSAQEMFEQSCKDGDREYERDLRDFYDNPRENDYPSKPDGYENRQDMERGWSLAATTQSAPQDLPDGSSAMDYSPSDGICMADISNYGSDIA